MPAAHASHCDVAPAVLLYVPGGHFEHEAELAPLLELNWPAGHANTQALKAREPAGLLAPLGHGVHALARPIE